MYAVFTGSGLFYVAEQVDVASAQSRGLRVERVKAISEEEIAGVPLARIVGKSGGLWYVKPE